MAEKNELVSSTSTSKTKKRKHSECQESQIVFESSESGSDAVVTISKSDASFSTSSRSPSVERPGICIEQPETEHSSSSHASDIWISQTKFEPYTSKWTRNILNMLKILPVITEVYTPMDLLAMAFPFNDVSDVDRVQTSKNIILQSRTPLHDLDIIDFDDTDAFSCFKLMLEKNLNNQWTHQVDLWNILPKSHADKLDKLQTRICKKFNIHGELFSQQMMHMSMAKKKGSLTQAMYQKLFEEFVSLFGLTSIAEPCVTDCTIEIGEEKVISRPDIIFPDLMNSSEQKEDLNVIAVCEVKRDFHLSTPVKTRSKEGKDEIQINHLSEELIGQHGGALLAHLPLSSNKNGILGIIVQKTLVTFVHFQCNQVQFEKIKKRENKFASKPVMLFSKPYNYLKASDRIELIEPFLTLGFQQFKRYQ